jgi:hypothetical protein
MHRVLNLGDVPGMGRASDDRLRERDARLAADDRSLAQVWLNDSPKGRSALDQKRHDLGKSGRTTTSTS